MKKLLLLAVIAVQSVLVAASHENLVHAIKQGDIERVKALIVEKAHTINPTEIKHAVAEACQKVSAHYKPLPWYNRYGSLAKAGLGALGLYYSLKFMETAISNNPRAENEISWHTFLNRFFDGQPSHSPVHENTRSINSTLCVTSGVVGTVSAVALWQGIKELRKHTYKSRLMTVKALIEDAFRNR